MITSQFWQDHIWREILSPLTLGSICCKSIVTCVKQRYSGRALSPSNPAYATIIRCIMDRQFSPAEPTARENEITSCFSDSHRSVRIYFRCFLQFLWGAIIFRWAGVFENLSTTVQRFNWESVTSCLIPMRPQLPCFGAAGDVYVDGAKTKLCPPNSAIQSGSFLMSHKLRSFAQKIWLDELFSLFAL